ncbi:MAG TPA: TrkH family potassium uptake protein, partial [Spirochaetia bacterium]|nr:TrkH family potassium uptake protein [Spirochaetia bacterium]
MIIGSSGAIFAMAGVVCLTPMLAFFTYPAEERFWTAFAIPGLFLLVVGGLFWSLLPRGRRRFSIVDASVTVVLSWIVVCVVSAYPIERLANLTFTQAVFEAVSGWTTTGLSVVDVGTAPKVLLLWRSIMQLAGGAGLAIIMLAAFSLPIGAGLYRAEGRSDQLVPNVIRSAKLVVLLYTAYAGVGIVAYILAGMDPFDAVNQAFAAVSTGGFSTKADSIGYWNSPTIEAVTIPLMILGNMNFLTAYALFRGKLRAFVKNGEMKLLAVMIVLGVVAIFFLVTRTLYSPLSKSVRVAVFDTISAITTTGFSTESYNHWSASGILVFIVLMLIGGGTCSTAGGIKQFRVYLLFKSVIWDVKRLLLPRGTVIENSLWQGEERVFVRPETIREVGTFVFLYITLYFIGTFVMVSNGYGLQDSLFEFASTLGTVGLSVGVTSSSTPP